MHPALASLAVLAQEVHEEVAGPENPILPDIAEIIFGGLAFLIVFVALAKFAFPALNKMLGQRSEKIQGDLEGAEKAKQEADQVLAQYRAQLSDARGEANRVIEEARKTADSMRRDLLAKAEDEARQIVAKAQEEIRGERDRAFEELRAQVGALSVELAEKVVGETMTKDRHLKLVDGYIDELTKEKGSRGGS